VSGRADSGPGGRIVATGLLGVAALVLAGCGEGESATADPALRGLEADQVMTGVEHFLTEDGVRRAHLRADTVMMLDEGKTAHVRRYTIQFFDQRGDRRSTLTAIDGVYDMESGNMRASEDVVVVDPDESQRLTTDRLLYRAGEDRLESDVEFTLVRGRDTVRGTGFTTDPGLDSLTSVRPSLISPPGEGAAAPASAGDDPRAPEAEGAETATGDSLAVGATDTIDGLVDAGETTDTVSADTSRTDEPPRDTAPADTAPADTARTDEPPRDTAPADADPGVRTERAREDG